MLAGPQSARVKAVRRLHRRASRERSRRFLAEGPQAVREAIAAGAVLELFATAAAVERHGALVEQAEAGGADVRFVSDDAMASLATTVTPQGLVAVCPFTDHGIDDVLAGGAGLVAVLVHVRDPGNAGTVIRSADAAGADGVVLTEESVDLYNPKCVRSAAGSMFHLPVVNAASLAPALAAFRTAGLQVLAADASGPLSLDDAGDDRLAAPTAWLFGNEARGLPAEVADAADAVIRIPIHGRAESLNLSVSTALCMYATAGAQRKSARVVRHREGEPLT